MRSDRSVPKAGPSKLQNLKGLFNPFRWFGPKPYSAVFLDEPSISVLLTWWEREVGIPLLPNVKADHMTICYNPSASELEVVPFGLKDRIQIVGYAADDKGQTVMVKPLFCKPKNPYPHITIAVAPGVEPVYSNRLLERGWYPRSGPYLFGTVDVRKD